MLSTVNLLLIFFFFISVTKMMFSDKMISILLSVELMMLSIFFLMYNMYSSWFSNSMLCVIYLSFMVCESVMGLSMYIYITRISGKDHFKALNF